MLGRVANGIKRYGLPVDELRLYLVLNRMQAHSSLMCSYIARCACIPASSYHMNARSPTNACMPLDDQTYSRMQTRAECNERNLVDRTPPKPALSLDQPQQRCHSLPTPPLWVLGRVASGIRCCGPPVDEFRLYLVSIRMQANSSFVYSPIARCACIMPHRISHECSFTNECMHAFRRPNIFSNSNASGM